MQNLKPNDAVAALYSNEKPELSEAILASLSHAIFDGGDIRPAGPIQRAIARFTYRALQWTTRSRKHRDQTGSKATIFSNSILGRCRHPFATSLLGSSQEDSASLIEGGDPMNINYMMIAPEIRANGGLWDRLLLDTVQGKDVRLRMALEARATYEIAKRRLDRKEPVRLKAVAAGTGLSLILVYDRLVRAGYNPDQITVNITDREAANIHMANRLLDKLATTKENKFSPEKGHGISAETEDIFAEATKSGMRRTVLPYDVLTAIGILEYFQGFCYSTSEKKLNLVPAVDSATAQDLAMKLYEMTTDHASLIVNTYRDDASTRVLELFGRRFVYRSRADLRSLLASVNFRPAYLVGSGNIYDVEVYEKNLLPAERAPKAQPVATDESSGK